MSTILVPTDFSEYADYAIKAAFNIAKKKSCEIMVINVLDYAAHIEQYDFASINSSMLNDLYGEMRKHSEEKLAEIAKRAESEGITLVTGIKSGFPKDVVLDEAKEREVDLIIMGTRGAQGLEEVFVGSNTERVVRKAPCPVLTLSSDPGDFEIANIVFAADFDERSGENFQEVLDFAEIFDAKIHLVRINNPQQFENTQLALHRMEAFATRWKIKNYTTTQWDHERFEDGLIQFTNNVQGELIVIGTHGRTGLGHLMFGSFAENLVNHLKQPVLTFKITS